MLKRILPVLHFKVISRNSDCFGECITEYSDLNFSTVSLADHLLLPAAFPESITGSIPSCTDGDGKRLCAFNTHELCSRNKAGAVSADHSQDAPQTLVWKPSALSYLPQHKLLTHTRPSILLSHIFNSYFPTQPYPGTRSSMKEQCPPSALNTS